MKSIRAQCEAAYKKKVEGPVTDVMRTVAIDVMGGSALATPVKSGRARANYHIAVNRIDKTVSAETNMPDYLAIATGATASIKPTDEINISNNLPYIEKLNNGSSKQAPANFIETAVLNAKSRAKRNIKTTVRA